MLIDLTPEQIVDFAEPTFFVINYDKKDRGGRYMGKTHFQIARPGQPTRSYQLSLHKYRRKLGNETVIIYSNNALNNSELRRILTNPFKFVDEHPFSH